MKTLKAVRLEAGLGRRAFARAAGFHGQGEVTRYENGKYAPQFKAIQQMAGTLGVDPWEVIEFRPALEKAAAKGLIEHPGRNGHGS